MMKRIILSLLILAMLIPACALAAVSVVDSNGDPVSMTSGKYNLTPGTYTLGGTDSTGLSIHMSGSVTLKLDGLTINDTDAYGLEITGENDATANLVLSGADSSITGWKHGVYSAIPLTIDGPGSLYVESKKLESADDSQNRNRCAIKVEADTTITGGTITAKALDSQQSSIAIEVEGELTITGGRMILQGVSMALHSYGNMKIENADVTATAGDMTIWAGTNPTQKKIEIINSRVDAMAYDRYSIALFAQNGITIKDSAVDAYTTEDALNSQAAYWQITLEGVTGKTGASKDAAESSLTVFTGGETSAKYLQTRRASTVKLIYSPGNGLGTKREITIDQSEGLNYLLSSPEDLGFSAKDGGSFEGWLVDGSLVKPGEKTSIVKETTATAVWKEKTPDEPEEPGKDPDKPEDGNTGEESDNEEEPEGGNTGEEPDNEEEPEGGNTGEKPDDDADTGMEEIPETIPENVLPQTGDPSSLILWCCLLAAAGTGAAVMKRRHTNE